MSNSQRVRASDAKRLIHLVLDLQELPADPAVRKEHLLRQLCDLVGGRLGTWGEFLGDGRGSIPQPRTWIDCGWESPEQRECFTAWMAENGFDDPLSARAFAHPADLAVLRRVELMSDDDWYRSSFCECRRAANLDDAMVLCCRTRNQGALLALSVQRSWGDRRFSEADAALLGLLGSTLERIHRQLLTLPQEAVLGSLSPRLRQTLARLLEGDSEKQVAHRLGLSPHTVHDYVMVLYERFGVSSRGELLAKFMPPRGPGSDASDGSTGRR